MPNECEDAECGVECNCEGSLPTYRVVVSLRERSISDVTYSKVLKTEVSDGVLVLGRNRVIAKQFSLPVCEMIPLFNIFKLSMWTEE